jgi:hypothetical protein
MIPLEINGKKYQADVGPDVPLPWVIREYLTAMKSNIVSGPLERMK